ncbi:prolyl oligopeptidase family serine peptidase [Pseudoalteromonas sp. CNC9-20]|uniref:S9 family peptidase n=1 Tax=Pseudoalteromonas sp. CNC9-20 TaxID=2917750 RepID=UPI001EF6D482|nr:prolyl oligopeptidase family serine peptidase [Pseudoalteromonas sp. CNC9-20]MCG7568679.1 prolyl oligopeptidase family serine peptidase [Pseudoalteromonas sp. CNC9-20]
MFHKSVLAATIASSFILSGCQSTAQQSNTQVETNQTSAPSQVETPAKPGSVAITLEQAMADPDWIGNQPEGAFWHSDSNTVVYQQKQQGNQLRDTYTQAVGADSATKVTLAQLHTLGDDKAVYSQDNRLQAYVFKGDMFVRDTSANTLVQITKTSAFESAPQFLNDNSLVYRRGNVFMHVDLGTGLHSELANLKLEDKPIKVNEPKSYIAKEQHKLIDYVALQLKNQQDALERDQQLANENSAVVDATIYLGDKKRLVDAQLSPDGSKLIVALIDDRSWRADTDIMPNYITQDAGVESVPARRRVADAKPQGTELVYIDLPSKAKTTLTYNTLPGWNEDVLAEVKRENYARQGKEYESETKRREINLMMDWGWGQSAIQWNRSGSQVAVMLEAWDNKDRWIATVDFKGKKLVNQHRLHDDAWVNYTFNDFGWLNTSDTLYFLSEQSGYSHIYTKPLTGKASQRTKGQFEVSDLTLSENDQYLYYKANKKHPGIYEVYRLNLDSGNSEALTSLDGMTDYSLSPDEQKLLLQHSKIMHPPELYVMDAAPGAKVTQLTHTVSEQFKATKLVAPKVVAVPSSHGEQPVYAKVYYPSDYQSDESGNTRKAVIFNHGAGYLQNSHFGWSGYFREFMFHSLLASEGYVVMDMDYRASKGYGRDWRTAIYRQMGTPETQDLVDGVKWMQANANVDVERVGTYGGSYGGFMTFMALFTEPELFQAGAALRPVSDWAHYNAPYTSNILNHPDVDPIAYERSSPIYFAEGLEKPLLINAPMVDDNVFFQDVVRLVQRLIELEKEDFETAIFPVEPHGFVQPSSWLDEYRRIYKLFEENL